MRVTLFGGNPSPARLRQRERIVGEMPAGTVPVLARSETAVINRHPDRNGLVLQDGLGVSWQANRLQFGATDAVRLSDNALLNRFPGPFRQIVEKAQTKAKETGSEDVRAEHALWAMLATLHELSEKQRILPESLTDSQKKSLRELTFALAPTEGMEPHEVMTSLWPMGQALESAMRSGTPEIAPDVVMDNPGLQSDLKRNLAELSRLPANKSNYPALLVERFRQEETHNGNNAFSQVARLLRGTDLPQRELLQLLNQKAPTIARWVHDASQNTRIRINREAQVGSYAGLFQQVIHQALQSPALNATESHANTSSNAEAKGRMEALHAFFTPDDVQDLPPAQLRWALQKAQGKLKGQPKTEQELAILSQSRQTRRLLQAFVTDPKRTDFSAQALITFFQQQVAGQTRVPETVQKLVEILAQIPRDARDGTLANLEDFEKQCPTVHQYGTNLVRQAVKGQLPEVLMRRESTDRLLAVINSGGSRTNLLLNAASGEGKTFAVLGLARRLAEGDVPKALRGTQLVQLDLGSMLAGSRYRGDFEERAKNLFTELNQYLDKHPRQKVMVFIDEIHNLAGTGDSEGAPNLLEMMKAAGVLERKNLTFIGATTPEDWQKSPLRMDQAFQGRFTPLALPGFSREAKLAILGRRADVLSEQKGVNVPVALLERILDQVASKWPGNTLRHAEDVLGLAASLATSETPLEASTLQDKLQMKELRLKTLLRQQQQGIPLKGQFLRAIQDARQDVESLKQDIDAYQHPHPDGLPSVTEKHIRQAMAIRTGETLGVLGQDEIQKLNRAQAILKQYIEGQDPALQVIEQGLREIAVRHKTGSIRQRPLVSMLLPGPTGVGKTEVAKVIAREFMNGNLIRIDMSDYMEKHSASRLTGSAPGYIGYNDGGLVDEVRKNPQSVIVFDEIEKAHPDVFNLLLQILEEGELRDNHQQPVSFRNAVIVMTSNLSHQGLTQLMQNAQHRAAMQKDPQLAARVLDREARQLLTADPASGRPGFRPELLGRLDYVIPFSPLQRQNVSAILDIRLRELNQEPYLRNQNLDVRLSKAAYARLITLATGNAANSDAATANHPFPVLPGLPAFPGGLDFRKGAPPGTKLAEDPNELQAGARDIRTVFERFIYKKLFNDLIYEPRFADLENAIITMDYDAQSGEFKLKVKPKPPEKFS